jgi:hypothetical protein
MPLRFLHVCDIFPRLIKGFNHHMKKNSILLIFAVLLSACSMTVGQFLGAPPTSTPTPTFTNTPTDMPTFTPTVPTPTFTTTPTLIGLKTKTSVPDFTPTQLILTPLGVTLLPSVTPISLVTQVPMPGFVSISVSDEQFYKGKECLPGSVKFTAQVADPTNTAFVLLFVRFKSKQTGTTSEWTDSIAMESIGVGTFAHDLIPSEMKALDIFENAWVQYQLVATDSNSNKIGKTEIFSERLTLLECVITPTPTVTITPTVLVP